VGKGRYAQKRRKNLKIDEKSEPEKSKTKNSLINELEQLYLKIDIPYRLFCKSHFRIHQVKPALSLSKGSTQFFIVGALHPTKT